ncbi:efflux transporter periplasmic adaptor subunit [Caulobacter sp. CCUG 60055]|uniref:efflux RND transporter periplasmic adaptor subunit n=1 Tax=Caulobacter sp. CCUG 60055 TaxID=2100090 RepID=UPI001FA79EA6|nr:efflux RND transporter periplasmic adaptor subunit [Caulobacter sp. CCUG 60055]MBQ1541367.1 efflux RND transporter periplasmic adaptor subunit [Caulobacteraceae bacterium]MCI3182014.1 efflux transporter periplasmic adaptor subunit [Caulobacter sp. CCUG 60055]
MRAKASHLFAAGIVIAVALFFAIGALFGGGKGKAAGADKPRAKDAPLVQAPVFEQALRPYAVVVRGRTQANRTVQVKSQTSGVVAETPILQGGAVGAGAVLCRLAVDARQASLDQARATLRSVQLQHQASANLAAKGFRSPTQVAQDQANLDAAAAAVRQAEVALGQINLRAPFAGVFDHRDAEVGAYLSPGQPCGVVIELDPMLIVGDLSETEAAKVRVGAIAQARLSTGEALQGRVRYVAHDADAQTRTYRVEITVANPRSAARSGVSADVRVEAGSGPAHLVPAPALVLDSAGRQGVRFVGAGEVVGFTPVTVLDETPDGVWVSGLNGPTRVITVGQSYVSEGQKVRVAAR